MWTVPRIWEGGHCVIIGGGSSIPYQFDIPDYLIKGVQSGNIPPSSYSPYMQALNNFHVIGVNHSFLFGDFIDVLFYGDSVFYSLYQKEIDSF